MSIFSREKPDSVEPKPGESPSTSAADVKGVRQSAVDAPKVDVKIPKLEIKELVTSTEEIANPTLLREFGESTFCVGSFKGAENKNQIMFFDNKMREVNDFKKIGDASVAIGDYFNRLAEIFKRYLCHKNIFNEGIDVDQESVFVRMRYYKVKPERKIESYAETRALDFQDNNVNGADLSVLAQGKYIVFYRAADNFCIAYKIKNEAGIPLAPRNWERFDLATPKGDVPADLTAEMENLIKEDVREGEKLIVISDLFKVKVTPQEVKVIGKDGGKDRVLFTDKIDVVKNNLVADPANPKVIYYCRSASVPGIVKLDLGVSMDKVSPVLAEFSAPHRSVTNLSIDPSGRFFYFYSDEDLVVLHKDTMQEVARKSGTKQAIIDEKNHLRYINVQGKLVIAESNLADIGEALEKQRQANLLAGFDVKDIFKDEGVFVAGKSRNEKANQAELSHLNPIRDELLGNLKKKLEAVADLDEIKPLADQLTTLRQQFMAKGLKEEEAAYIVESLDEEIVEKRKNLAGQDADQVLVSVEKKISGAVSLTVILEARAELESLSATESFLDAAKREELRKLRETVDGKAAELFKTEGQKILVDVKSLVDGARHFLDGLTKKSEFDDWEEFRHPQLKSRLGKLYHDCPIEAVEVAKAIAAARTDLDRTAEQYRVKFEQEYAQVREQAAEKIGAAVDMVRKDLDGLIDRLRAKNFQGPKAREDAETYLAGSAARQALEEEIAGLQGQNPEAAEALRRELKAQMATTLSLIESGSLSVNPETGQQMVKFGQVEFPRWEAKVEKKKQTKEVNLVFEPSVSSLTYSPKNTEVRGEIKLEVASGKKKERVSVYGDLGGLEAEARLGGLRSAVGYEMSAAQVDFNEFKAVKNDLREWSKGGEAESWLADEKEWVGTSRLRAEYVRLRQEMRAIYAKYRGKQGDKSVKGEYAKKLGEFNDFCAKHHLSILRRFDRAQKEPLTEYANGKGYVPEWSSHWVVDEATEENLEEMAKALKMQSELQEGVLNLKGHAGTGKDVLVKMFCSRTNRPYFATDCTKWTTEYELSEDVVLESKDGASQTVRVPSAVLTGITTPGAVVYFNEINGMPEQAQIFLHALFDEKRALTLKTSSGKVIKAEKSVLLVSSMNPGYPGTFAPQFATKSRMVPLEVGYPELFRKQNSQDPNPNPAYSAAEALRIARGVSSLVDFTYEANLKRNEFVRIWDKEVNGVADEAPQLSVEQKFDLQVILALVQFGDKLRREFIANFEKTKAAHKALPVSQPLTARELRRCAYMLSKMKPAEKKPGDEEKVARDLLEKFFLSNIDSSEDRRKVKDAMMNYRSEIRKAA